MREIKYNNEQIKELESNKYVKSCTNKNINFTKECKLVVLELNQKWLFTKKIFEKLWFPEYVINSKIPSKSLDRWKRNIKRKWLIEENKWRKKKEYFDLTKMSKDEELEYLRAKVAILEELKKLVDWDYP